MRFRLILVGIVVITAIIGATAKVVDMQRLASIDAFRTATTNLGNGMAQQTTQALASVNRALAKIQSDLISATPESINAAMRLKSIAGVLTEERSRLSGVDALTVIDAQGEIASISGAWPAAGNDIAGSRFFIHFKTNDDHELFVGPPENDPLTGNWSAVMARRVNDPNGRFAGVVAARISLTALQAFYHLAMPADRSVYVLRRDGVILVRYPPREAEIGKQIPPASPWYATVARGGGSYYAPGYFDTSPNIAVVLPLRNLPFVVEASVSEADTLAEWYRQRSWVLAGSIASIAGVILLLRLFAGQYRRLELSERSLAAKNDELDTAHEQLDATLANLPQGVCFYDNDQNVVVCNRQYCELFDLSEDAIRPGISLARVVELRIAAGSFPETADAEEFIASTAAIVREGKPQSRTFEMSNGRTFLGHIQPLPGRGWVVTNEDITLRHEAEAKIAHLARHDILTGLANRALFQERLEQALAMAERGKGFAVICLDLDGFKAVNDTHGHAVGDSLLRGVAGRLLDAMRESDTVARLGGDEFAILQLGVSEPIETTVVARRILQSIAQPFDLDGNQVSVGTSIGIAMAPGDGSHPLQLMKDADLALYRSKQEGRGTWRFFEPSMDAVARARRVLEADLRTALPSGQLELYYQPMVSGRTRTVTGFEALLRWRHPTRGVLPPAEFISVAEEVGLITEIGAWVLLQACTEAATWPEHLKVAVNFSTRQFRGQTLVGTVADALHRSGLSPNRLELEITESVSLQQDQATLLTLQDLHALGARIALDDFGIGNSSLSYLRGFPFDTIKIDRSFVNDMETHAKGLAVIRGIIGLAANLHTNVTAEGVETEAQFALLAAAGCTEIQGFLISRPVAAAQLPALIARLSGARATALPPWASQVAAVERVH